MIPLSTPPGTKIVCVNAHRPTLDALRGQHGPHNRTVD